MVIDLHLDDSVGAFHLESQISKFEKAVDDALLMSCSELRVIHGIGSGVLKKEIHKLLKDNKLVDKFVNDYHPMYGYGSTLIIFKS